MRKKSEVNRIAYDYSLRVEQWVQRSIYNDFELKHINFDWNPKRTASRGGKYAKGYGFNIAMIATYLSTTKGIVHFKEYPSYSADTVIGDLYSTNPLDKLRATILHETAHAIQMLHYEKNNIRCKPHGPIFKKYYSLLRVNLVNNTLGDQNKLKKDFEVRLANIQRIGGGTSFGSVFSKKT